MSLTIERCRPFAEKQALALAAHAWPENERAGQWQTIRSTVERGEEDRIVLLAARQNDELVAAVLGQVLAGNSSIVWLPQFDVGNSAARPSIAAALLKQLAHELQASGAHLAQALIAAGDRASAEMLQFGGFEHAADLLYLVAHADSFPIEPPALPLDLVSVGAADEARLARLIDRTYVGTRDCPRIDGMRRTADVIAGYRAVGEHRPELWLLARQGGSDIGCLLVNLHPDVRHAEIVYLALVPEVRGRQFGKHLVRQAQWLARQADCERLVLAVDAANDPAILMYGATGFVEWDRRSVWVQALGHSASS